MLVLALDQSTTKTGWCSGPLDSPNPVVYDSGTFNAEGKTWIARLDSLSDWLQDAGIAYDVLAYEIPTHRRSALVARRLGAAEYVTVKAAAYNQCFAWGFTASQVAATKFGKRHLEASARLLGHTPTEDEADALAVYYLAWQAHHRQADPSEKY